MIKMADPVYTKRAEKSALSKQEKIFFTSLLETSKGLQFCHCPAELLLVFLFFRVGFFVTHTTHVVELLGAVEPTFPNTLDSLLRLSGRSCDAKMLLLVADTT